MVNNKFEDKLKDVIMDYESVKEHFFKVSQVRWLYILSKNT